MAFPHPQSRKANHRDRDKPNNGRVVWKFFKRTINITNYRNGKHDVNPTKNRTFGCFLHFLTYSFTVQPSDTGRLNFVDAKGHDEGEERRESYFD